MIVHTKSGAVGIDSVGEGVPLLLLHGFPLDRTMWRAQLAAPIPGVRMIAADLPGCGESDPTDTPTLESWADRIAELCDALALDRVILGGFSMGGYCTFAFWRRHPTRVRALVLVDTKAGADNDEARAKRLDMQALLADKGPLAIAEKMMPGLIGKTTREREAPVVAELAEIIKGSAPRAIHDALDALRTRADSTPTLDTITVPTLIVCGEEDVLTPPAESRAMQAAIAGSRLALIPGVGHASCAEAPDTFNALLSEWAEATISASPR